MRLNLYQIDAFTSQVFSGNPAAVCPLEVWPDDALMQRIAMENNLSETAFFVPEGSGYGLRWFTPTCEVDMCGHATLASAYVLFECLGYEQERITFTTKSGNLHVKKSATGYVMDFPVQRVHRCDISDSIKAAFGVEPLQTFAAMDYMVVFKNEAEVYAAKPNINLLKELPLRGVCITAQGSECDVVTRFFAPKYGINEDPVTGSAFTQLVAYWSRELHKEILHIKQVSGRGGEAICRVHGQRVLITATAVKYFEGVIDV